MKHTKKNRRKNGKKKSNIKTLKKSHGGDTDVGGSRVLKTNFFIPLNDFKDSINTKIRNGKPINDDIVGLFSLCDDRLEILKNMFDYNIKKIKDWKKKVLSSSFGKGIINKNVMNAELNSIQAFFSLFEEIHMVINEIFNMISNANGFTSDIIYKSRSGKSYFNHILDEINTYSDSNYEKNEIDKIRKFLQHYGCENIVDDWDDNRSNERIRQPITQDEYLEFIQNLITEYDEDFVKSILTYIHPCFINKNLSPFSST